MNAAKLRRHPKVDLVYRDQDGWWIELKPGWAFDPAEPPYGGCHTLSEDTVAELADRLTWDIKPCRCVDCIKEGRE